MGARSFADRQALHIDGLYHSFLPPKIKPSSIGRKSAAIQAS
jgi:hypothetical protein